MSERRGRTVPLLNGAVATALVAALAAVALVVRPPAPPGIAEFAPQATKPITKAPLGQSAGTGSGTGGACLTDWPCASPSAQPTGVPASMAPPKPGELGPGSLQCYTWPDGSVTQTFDPQSPPCVAAWPDAAKGNGGATARGVTRTEIQVALPADGFYSQQGGLYEPVVDFINSHFMLYGRKFVIKPFTARMNAGSHAVEEQAADARTVLGMRPFAALPTDITGEGAEQSTYFERVAAGKVVMVTGVRNTGVIRERVFRQHDPYLWSYQPTWETEQANLATLICRQLAGKVAAHSSAFETVPRRFALLLPGPKSNDGAPTPNMSALVDSLASCKVKIDRTVEYDDTSSEGSNALGASFLQLNRDRVTSVIYVRAQGGSPVNPSTADFAAGSQYGPMPTASRVNYHPEWVYVGQDVASARGFGNQTDQTSALFGIAPWNRDLPEAQMSWYQAYLQGGGTPSAARDQAGALYNSLMLLASGVQAAGPILTPQSFATALRQLRFPNPTTGRAPTWSGRVGVGPDGYSMVYDFGAVWFPPRPSNARGEGAPLWCNVDGGARWSDDSWGREDRFFSDPNC
jgi:hypothetical protein